MILPYIPNNPATRRPVATLMLLGIMGLASSCVWIYDRAHSYIHSAEPSALTWFGILPGHFNPLTLVSYMVIHTGIGHLAANAFYLWVFGTGLEMVLNRKTYLGLFLAGGVLGGILQWLVTLLLLNGSSQEAPIVGASAACFTLIGLYAVRYYRAVIHFVGMPFKLHVVYVVAAFLLYEVASGIVTLVAGDASDGVAHWAHIGGFVFGLVCAQAMHLAEAGERAYLNEDASEAMKQSHYGEAIQKWETLLQREPNNLDARLELARAWSHFGDKEQASAEYGVLLGMCQERELFTDMAIIYAEMVEQDVKAQSVPTDILFKLAATLIDMECYPLANEPLRQLYLDHPESEQAEMALLESAALCIHHLERIEEARYSLRLYRERYPDSQYRELANDLDSVLERTVNGRAASRSAAQILASLPQPPPTDQTNEINQPMNEITSEATDQTKDKMRDAT